MKKLFGWNRVGIFILAVIATILYIVCAGVAQFSIFDWEYWGLMFIGFILAANVGVLGVAFFYNLHLWRHSEANQEPSQKEGKLGLHGWAALVMLVLLIAALGYQAHKQLEGFPVVLESVETISLVLLLTASFIVAVHSFVAEMINKLRRKDA